MKTKEEKQRARMLDENPEDIPFNRNQAEHSQSYHLGASQPLRLGRSSSRFQQGGVLLPGPPFTQKGERLRQALDEVKGGKKV